MDAEEDYPPLQDILRAADELVSTLSALLRTQEAITFASKQAVENAKNPILNRHRLVVEHLSRDRAKLWRKARKCGEIVYNAARTWGVDPKELLVMSGTLHGGWVVPVQFGHVRSIVQLVRAKAREYQSKPSKATLPNFKPARWFTSHTQITADSLRKAAQKKQIRFEKVPKGQNVYSLTDAKERWPHLLSPRGETRK
jgi:hypothetical protein